MPELDRQPRRLVAAGLVIEERAQRSAIDLRGDPRDVRFVRAVQSVTDLLPPSDASATASGLLGSILWLGPDQWLILSDTQAAEGLIISLHTALKDIPSAVTDVGHARIVYAVSGSNARALLAKGCLLDLHERAFPLGRSAQTLLAKVPVIVHRSGAEPRFDLFVAHSFRDYAWNWLQTAASEYAGAGAA
jgi:sarcosine oxidase, subunit gamma